MRVPDPERGRVGVGHRVGDRERVRDVDDRLLGEPADPVGEARDAHDAAAVREVGAVAAVEHDTRDLLAGRERQRRCERVRAAAHEHVGQPERRGTHADPQLPGPRNGRVDLDELEDGFGLRVLPDLPGAHQVVTATGLPASSPGKPSTVRNAGNANAHTTAMTRVAAPPSTIAPAGPSS